MKSNDGADTALFFCAVVGGIALLLVIFLVPWPGTRELWIGSSSVVEAISQVFTPVGILTGVLALYLNGRASDETLRQSQQAEAAVRFQKACEMLNSSEVSISMAGTALLKTLALQYPTEYWPSTLRVLEAFSSSCNSPIKNRYWENEEIFSLDDLDDLPISDKRADAAFEAIGALHKLLTWPDEALFDGKFVLGSVYDGHTITAEWSLWDVDCPQWIAHNASIYRGDIRKSHVTLAIGTDVELHNFDARGATLVVQDLTRVSSFAEGCPEARLKIVGGQWEGATINDQPIDVWLERCRRIAQAPIPLHPSAIG